MTIQTNRINSATNFAFSTIAENGLTVQTGDLLSLNEGGFITKATPWSVIFGISHTKNSFPSDNEENHKMRVEYSPIIFENSYKMKVPGGDTSKIKIGKFYKIDQNQEIDASTASPSVGQLMVQDVFSTYVEVRFVSSVGLNVDNYEDVKLVRIEPQENDTAMSVVSDAPHGDNTTGVYKFIMSNGDIVIGDFSQLNWRNKDLDLKKINVREEVNTEKIVSNNAELENANINTAHVKTLNMKEEGAGVIDANEVKATKATINEATFTGTATTTDQTFPTYQARSEKEQPNGYAALDQDGKIKETQYHEGMIKCMKWRGERDPQSGLLPSNPVHGDTYLVHSNGVINGNQWTKGDLLVYDGANNGEWNRVPVGDTKGMEVIKNKTEAIDLQNPSKEKYTSEFSVAKVANDILTKINEINITVSDHKEKIEQTYSKTEVLFLINKTFDAIKDSIALLQNQVNYQNFITKLVESLKKGGLTKDQIEAILGVGNFFVEATLTNANSVEVVDARITQTTFVSAIVPDDAKGHITVEVQNGKIIVRSSKTETSARVSILLTTAKS